MTPHILSLEKSWSVLRPLLKIRNEGDYQRSIEQLNDLVDLVGADEQHPLYLLLDILGILVEAYEIERIEIPEANGIEILQYLMEEHAWTLADLPEIGSPDDVHKVITGEKELGLHHIRALSQWFQVLPAVFV